MTNVCMFLWTPCATYPDTWILSYMTFRYPRYMERVKNNTNRTSIMSAGTKQNISLGRHWITRPDAAGLTFSVKMITSACNLFAKNPLSIFKKLTGTKFQFCKQYPLAKTFVTFASTCSFRLDKFESKIKNTVRSTAEPSFHFGVGRRW